MATAVSFSVVTANLFLLLAATNLLLLPSAQAKNVPFTYCDGSGASYIVKVDAVHDMTTYGPGHSHSATTLKISASTTKEIENAIVLLVARPYSGYSGGGTIREYLEAYTSVPVAVGDFQLAGTHQYGRTIISGGYRLEMYDVEDDGEEFPLICIDF